MSHDNEGVAGLRKKCFRLFLPQILYEPRVGGPGTRRPNQTAAAPGPNAGGLGLGLGLNTSPFFAVLSLSISLQ
jgi:hypothetical protein